MYWNRIYYWNAAGKYYKLPCRANGGIRLGNEALIFKDKLLCKNWIFVDDSYYLGRTKAGISVALRKVRPDASIFETYVIYDGSMGRADKVKSMYRYSK